jgi:hypothetical protein
MKDERHGARDTPGAPGDRKLILDWRPWREPGAVAFFFFFFFFS